MLYCCILCHFLGSVSEKNIKRRIILLCRCQDHFSWKSIIMRSQAEINLKYPGLYSSRFFSFFLVSWLFTVTLVLSNSISHFPPNLWGITWYRVCLLTKPGNKNKSKGRIYSQTHVPLRHDNLHQNKLMLILRYLYVIWNSLYNRNLLMTL